MNKVLILHQESEIRSYSANVYVKRVVRETEPLEEEGMLCGEVPV